MNKYPTIKEMIEEADYEMLDKCKSDCNKCKWGKEIKNGMNLDLMKNTICNASSFLYAEWSDIYDD